MKKKSEGFVMPVVVLLIICLVVGFGLAYINSITSPIITAAAAAEEEEAKKNVLPQGSDFEDVTSDDLPDGVVSAFVAGNGAGSVYICEGAGYGGVMKIIVGIDSDGLVTGVQVLDHSETVGLGSRVADEEFRSQFVGEDESLSTVQTIGGSTISSKCVMNLVGLAYEARALVGEGA